MSELLGRTEYLHRVVHVGAGEIFQKRYLQAYRNLYDMGVLELVLVADVDERRLRNLPVPTHLLQTASTTELTAVLGQPAIKDCAVVVATPTTFHVPISIALIDSGKRFAVEKPVAPSYAELRSLEQHVARSKCRKPFIFQYYAFEKALSLIGLYRNEYIVAAHRTLLDANFPKLASVRARLGKYIRIDGVIIEDEDSRSWVTAPGSGGHAMETFSHLVSMALVVEPAPELTQMKLGTSLKFHSGDNETVMFGEYVGREGEVVRLGCVKGDLGLCKQRWIRIEHENGCAFMDLEAKRLVISLGNEDHVVALSAQVDYQTLLLQFGDCLDSRKGGAPFEEFSYELAMRAAFLSAKSRSVAVADGIKSVSPIGYFTDALDGIRTSLS